MKLSSWYQKVFFSPFWLLLAVLLGLFLAEAGIMFIMPLLLPLPAWLHALVDPILLTIIGFPLLYLFLFRPLKYSFREQKRWMQEVRRANAELEEKVRERTASLERAYSQLQKEVKESHRLRDQIGRQRKMEAVGNLAAGVAHDLNNLLSGLVGYPDLLLLDLPPDHRQRQRILRIKQAAEQAAAIVEDLLAIARGTVVSPAPVCLNRLVENQLESAVMDRLRERFPHVSIQTVLASDLPAINGSRVHLAKSLLNLLINAAEAIPEQGSIQIATRNREVDRAISGYEVIAPGDYAVLSISDKGGTGIPASDLERIFEPFYSKKQMGSTSGTGLGLSVVWSTVKDHGGYIDVQSEPNQGTTIELYFPISSQPAPDGQASVELQAFHGDEHILIVDDLLEQRELLSSLLGKLGYSVSQAATCEEALEHLRAEPADLVLLDMVMTGRDGLETYKSIREIKPNQKTVLISGYADSERVLEAQRLGAGPFLRKPFSIEALGAAIRTELDGPEKTVRNLPEN